MAAAALLLCPPAALGDTPPAFVTLPTIEGDAVVGATLTAAATWTGDPAPVAKYTWRRCRATGGTCDAIDGASASQYVVTADDLGFRLGVRIALKVKGVDAVTEPSVTTAVVVGAPPPPSDPPPPADPDPGSATDPGAGSALVPESGAPILSVAAHPTLLRPFPVVRIRGYFKPGGVRVTLLSVNAPRSAHIAVRCAGKGCPVRTLALASAPARLRPFERFLPAGTVLQVRVTRNGRIGKYASFRIRAHSAPLRTDRCLLPGRGEPAACPA